MIIIDIRRISGVWAAGHFNICHHSLADLFPHLSGVAPTPGVGLMLVLAGTFAGGWVGRKEGRQVGREGGKQGGTSRKCSREVPLTGGGCQQQ